MTARADQAAATRAKLVHAARLLFEAVGYQAATIRALAKFAELSTGAVFVHFADKAAIYREVFGHDPLTPEEGRYWRARALELEGRQ